MPKLRPPVVYLIEPEDVTRLRSVANRLGDMQTLTSDQRRDLMNMISLVVGRLTPWSPEHE